MIFHTVASKTYFYFRFNINFLVTSLMILKSEQFYLLFFVNFDIKFCFF